MKALNRTLHIAECYVFMSSDKTRLLPFKSINTVVSCVPISVDTIVKRMQQPDIPGL